jgi:hypothetical protein
MARAACSHRITPLDPHDPEGRMRKLKIDVDTLKVESFEIPAQAEPKGTVIAHAPSYPDPVWTCAYHCTWMGTTCET